MKKENIIKSLIIIGFIAVVIIYISIADFSSPRDDTEQLLKRIDKLELKIDSLNTKKDSIRTVIDSTHIKIITNEKHYKEVVNTIISQPADSDSSFITNYIRFYRSKNDLSNIR